MTHTITALNNLRTATMTETSDEALIQIIATWWPLGIAAVAIAAMATWFFLQRRR